MMHWNGATKVTHLMPNWQNRVGAVSRWNGRSSYLWSLCMMTVAGVGHIIS
jgi:hypothetical protein